MYVCLYIFLLHCIHYNKYTNFSCPLWCPLAMDLISINYLVEKNCWHLCRPCAKGHGGLVKDRQLLTGSVCVILPFSVCSLFTLTYCTLNERASFSLSNDIITVIIKVS